MFKIATTTALLLLVVAAVAVQWVDPNSPDTLPEPLKGSKYKLVFSDEFEEEGRDFRYGHDDKWEAVDKHYSATGE